MGLYITRTTQEELDLSSRERATEQLEKDGAVKQVHPKYQEYTIALFSPDFDESYFVVPFVFSRKEFNRFLNNFGARIDWFVYPNVVHLMRPDTIRLHKMDVEGPSTFEELDRREEMEALMRSLRNE